MYPRSFWWGVAIAGAVYLWRRQLRPLAVKGAKVGLLFNEGIKDNVQAAKDVYFDLKQDAQMEQVRREAT